MNIKIKKNKVDTLMWMNVVAQVKLQFNHPQLFVKHLEEISWSLKLQMVAS